MFQLNSILSSVIIKPDIIYDNKYEVEVHWIIITTNKFDQNIYIRPQYPCNWIGYYRSSTSPEMFDIVKNRVRIKIVLKTTLWKKNKTLFYSKMTPNLVYNLFFHFKNVFHIFFYRPERDKKLFEAGPNETKKLVWAGPNETKTSLVGRLKWDASP